MTPAYALVTTCGYGHDYIVPSYNHKVYRTNTDGTSFKCELAIQYPKATIEWTNEKADFNDYLIKFPSKAMAKRCMWDFSRSTSLATYWLKKFYHFIDDETDKEIKLYCGFFYIPKAERDYSDN